MSAASRTAPNPTYIEDMSTSLSSIGIRTETSPDGDVTVFGPAKQPNHHSYSSLTTFAACPAEWFFNYQTDLNRQQPDNDGPRLIGAAVHFALDLISKGSTLTEASNAMVDKFELEDEASAKASEMLDRAVKWEHTDPTRDSLLESERELCGNIAGWRFLGYADGIEEDPDGVKVVVDYKTGRAPKPVSVDRLDPDSEPIYQSFVTRQGVLYAVMLRQEGIWINRVRMVYPNSELVIEVDLDDYRGGNLLVDAERFVEYTADRVAQAVDAGAFRASPSDGKCGRCAFSGYCPASAVESVGSVGVEVAA